MVFANCFAADVDCDIAVTGGAGFISLERLRK
jgi:hypothetical protein